MPARRPEFLTNPRQKYLVNVISVLNADKITRQTFHDGESLYQSGFAYHNLCKLAK